MNHNSTSVVIIVVKNSSTHSHPLYWWSVKDAQKLCSIDRTVCTRSVCETNCKKGGVGYFQLKGCLNKKVGSKIKMVGV